MFDDERAALYRQYQEASVKIVLLSMYDLAASVRDKEPEARYVYITASDQSRGGYWSTAITDADGEELAENLEELDMDDMATLGNLQDDEFATPSWQVLVEDNPTEDISGEYRIDIDRVLEKLSPADFAVDASVVVEAPSLT